MSQNIAKAPQTLAMRKQQLVSLATIEAQIRQERWQRSYDRAVAKAKQGKP